jgi:hypothetical protein
MKKRVLICLVGLARTFKRAAPLLFERIIEPNKDRYDFDIVINTDLKGVGLTYGRPDTAQTGRSVYQYNDESTFISDLMETYKIPRSAITFYNFEVTKPVMSWFLTYKRLGLLLSNRQQYDMYILMRMDAYILNPVKLTDFERSLVFYSSTGPRPGYFHDRDIVDAVVIGPHDAFMKWAYTFLLCTKTILKVFPELDNFIDNNIVSEEFIDKYLEEWNNNKDDLEEVAKRLGLNHSNEPWITQIIINNNVKKIDILRVYGEHTGSHLRNALLRSLSVITKQYKCILGEKMNLIYDIIR